MMAAYQGNSDMVHFLLNEAAADASIKDKSGKRAFERAKNSKI